MEIAFPIQAGILKCEHLHGDIQLIRQKGLLIRLQYTTTRILP